jgi:hypothetical protein
MEQQQYVQLKLFPDPLPAPGLEEAKLYLVEIPEAGVPVLHHYTRDLWDEYMRKFDELHTRSPGGVFAFYGMELDPPMHIALLEAAKPWEGTKATRLELKEEQNSA